MQGNGRVKTRTHPNSAVRRAFHRMSGKSPLRGFIWSCHVDDMWMLLRNEDRVTPRSARWELWAATLGTAASSEGEAILSRTANLQLHDQLEGSFDSSRHAGSVCLVVTVKKTVGVNCARACEDHVAKPYPVPESTRN